MGSPPVVMHGPSVYKTGRSTGTGKGGLLAGGRSRALAFASGVLPRAMTFSGRGVEAALSCSVYTAAGGELLLAAAPAAPDSARSRGQRAKTP
ncbi:hypothetical protein WMF04_26940 [Sorangium sp. So ce260]|uniref:hypothetical protein n=1 Tax=Sorangium sp. So ce260 TaxID=3133291 RepID=UPI003F608B93